MGLWDGLLNLFGKKRFIEVVCVLCNLGGAGQYPELLECRARDTSGQYSSP